MSHSWYDWKTSQSIPFLDRIHQCPLLALSIPELLNWDTLPPPQLISDQDSRLIVSKVMHAALKSLCTQKAVCGC